MINKKLYTYPLNIWLRNIYKYRIQRVNIIRYFYIITVFYLWDTRISICTFLINLVLYTLFSILMIIDIENKIILFPLNVLGLIIGFYYGIMTNGFHTTVFGGVTGMGIFLGIFFLGILAKWLIKFFFTLELKGEPIGFGDVILACTIGLVVGWPIILNSLLITIVISGLISSIIILFSWLLNRYQKFYSIAYSPYLITGAIITLNYQSILSKI